jgi:hypothetical protein
MGHSKVQQGLPHDGRAMRHSFYSQVSIKTSSIQIRGWLLFNGNWRLRLDFHDSRVSIGPHSLKIHTPHLFQLMLGLDLYDDNCGIRRHLPKNYTRATHRTMLRNLRHGNRFSNACNFHNFFSDGLLSKQGIYRNQAFENSR